nr:MAG TPA: hypothetical protein [Caudoviricetes sp.]
MRRCSKRPNKKHFTRSEMAGFLFCPDAIQPHTSVYSGLSAVHAAIPPSPQNSTQGFTGAFLVIYLILLLQITDRHKRI